jgi:hypothetical protein
MKANILSISTDGITWTYNTDCFSIGTGYFKEKYTIKSIIFGDGKFVAAGNKYIAYSTDGITWTATKTESLGLNIVYFNSIAYGNGKFVAVGNKLITTTNDNIAYSSDGGITWTLATTTAFDYIYNGKLNKEEINVIAFGNGKFVAGGARGRLATSTDGITWTPLPDETFGIDEMNEGGNVRSIESIAYGNGKFVVVGFDYSFNSGLLAASKIIILPGN